MRFKKGDEIIVIKNFVSDNRKFKAGEIGLVITHHGDQAQIRWENNAESKNLGTVWWVNPTYLKLSKEASPYYHVINKIKELDKKFEQRKELTHVF
jgi:hypothetical protein